MVLVSTLVARIYLEMGELIVALLIYLSRLNGVNLFEIAYCFFLVFFFHTGV